MMGRIGQDSVVTRTKCIGNGRSMDMDFRVKGFYSSYTLRRVKVRVFTDSWYMRRFFVESMQQRGFDAIGQVRIDMRLYDVPPPRKKGLRGRNRKYGDKYTPKRIAHFKRTPATLKLYGKEQVVRYRSKLVKARFLDAQLVPALWCEFKSDNGSWTSTCLLFSTDTTLAPEPVIESYGLRWSVESMSNQLRQISYLILMNCCICSYPDYAT